MRLARFAASLLVAAVAVFAGHVAAAEQADDIAPLVAPLPPQSLAGGAAVIIMGLLLLLYVYRQRLYILYWIAGWGAFAASMFTAARPPDDAGVGGVIFGLSQLLLIGSALCFVVAADAYRTSPRFRRVHLALIVPIALWFLVAPLVIGRGAVFAPGHLLAGLVFAIAGATHILITRSARLAGAAVIGTMFVLIALLHTWIAATQSAWARDVLSASSLLELAIYLVTALGMQLMTFEDMTYELRHTNNRLEAAQTELRQMVITDALTGCRNRRFFDEVIARELSARRRYGRAMSLVFVDVDRFKAVNDTLGHAAGDRVLRDVAHFLMRHTRDADYVFRWGGDEFLLLLSCREEEAQQRGRELQVAFANTALAVTVPQGLALSVGCAEVPLDAATAADALKLADERMYLHKRNARLASARAV